LKHLVLWDPVVDGREYIGQLRRMQRHEQPSPPRTPAAPVEELLGYFYPDDLIAELERLDLAAHTPQADRISLLLSGESESTGRLLARLDGLQPRPTVHASTKRGPWEDPNAHTLHFLLPQERRAVVNLLGGAKP
jgi:hypothetical protein